MSDLRYDVMCLTMTCLLDSGCNLSLCLIMPVVNCSSFDVIRFYLLFFIIIYFLIFFYCNWEEEGKGKEEP